MANYPEHTTNWGWLPEISSAHARDIGSTLLDLIMAGENWVHRRVETIAVIDTELLRHRISVDFTLPRNLPRKLYTPDKTPLFIVPVTLLPRRSGLMHFDVEDQSGASIPFLTKKEDARLTAVALLALAARTLRKADIPLGSVLGDGRLGRTLSAIPFREFNAAVNLTASILVPDSQAWQSWTTDRQDRAARDVLRRDRGFSDFLALVTGNSIMSVPIVGQAGMRQLLTLQYDEEIDYSGFEDDASGTRLRLLRNLRPRPSSVGWSATNMTVAVALVGSAETHHVQIDAPANTEFTATVLESHRPTVTLRTSMFRAPKPTPFYSAFWLGAPRHSHLYVPKAHQLTSGTVVISLRAERESVLTAAAFAGTAIAIVLWFYYHDINNLIKSTPALSWFPLIPGLLAGYFARSGEHRLVRRLLAFPRSLLTISALLPLVAVVSVAAMSRTPSKASLTQVNGSHWIETTPAPHASGDLKHVLFWLAFSSTIVTGALLVSRIFPVRQHTPTKRHRRHVGQTAPQGANVPTLPNPPISNSNRYLVGAVAGMLLLIVAVRNAIQQMARQKPKI